ncbi:MAG: hypothetical protein K6C98_02560 [Treponema sp.]|nr:hypothetical protein [Treponema sp.]
MLPTNLSTINNQQAVDSIVEVKEQTEEKVQEQHKDVPNMITIDRTKAEDFLLILEECIGDVQEQKNLVDKLIDNKKFEFKTFQDETIKKFNNLISTTQSLSEKLNATESYEVYLEEKVKNASLNSEIALLEQQLQKEKAEFSAFLIKTETFLTQNINQIMENVRKLKTVDEMIDQKIKIFTDKLESEAIKFNNDVEQQMNEVSDSLIKGSNNQKEILVSECNSMLKAYTEKCQQHLETVQKQAIDFLKQCKSENTKLIEKVPAVANNKISKKDLVIFVLSIMSIVSFVCNYII